MKEVVSMTKKERKAARKEYFDKNYDNYVYNAPVDPRDEPMYDSIADKVDMYGTWYPTNDTNIYPINRDYKK